MEVTRKDEKEYSHLDRYDLQWQQNKRYREPSTQKKTIEISKPTNFVCDPDYGILDHAQQREGRDNDIENEAGMAGQETKDLDQRSANRDKRKQVHGKPEHVGVEGV